jgi:hypothetical protein
MTEPTSDFLAPQNLPKGNLPSKHQQALMQMINGHWVAQMIHVAARLGIADLVADGPRSVDELAQITGTHAPALYRLLRGLASVGVFAEDEQGRIGLTPLADLLRTGVPNSLRDWSVFVGSTHTWRSWEQLLYSVTTGETAFPHVWGASNWEYRSQNPEANDVFNKAMTSASKGRIGLTLAAYDFSAAGTLVDVGGSQGAFLAAILSAYPDVRGILFDLPHVVTSAPPVLAAAGVSDRCEIVGGSFLDSVPEGGDTYLLSKVIHDWDDDRAVVILRNCRQVMHSAGRLLLVEAVIPPGNNSHPGKLSDLNMLVINSGGRERTEKEFRALFAASNFALTRVHPTGGEVSVIEAAPD